MKVLIAATVAAIVAVLAVPEVVHHLDQRAYGRDLRKRAERAAREAQRACG